MMTSWPALGQSPNTTPISGYPHSSIMKREPLSPARESSRALPIGAIREMATWSSAQEVGSSTGKQPRRRPPPLCRRHSST